MKAQTKMQLATKATKMTKSKMRSFSSTFGMFWQEAEVKWAMCSVFVTMDVQMLDVQVLDVCESQTLCWETEILLRPRGWMENIYTTILCNFPHSPYKDIKLLSKSTPFIPASTIRPTRLLNMNILHMKVYLYMCVWLWRFTTNSSWPSEDMLWVENHNMG